jgi:DNA invertase Pin-like site-specific DNA recombinase
MSDQHSSNGRPLRAAAYYRMSSDEQEGSIEQQQAWAKAAAARENAKVVAEFIDSGRPGTETARRTEFLRMLDFCREAHQKRQPIDAILCWNANRFSRSDSQETAWFIWEFRKVGTGLMLTASSGWIDFADDTHRLLFNITQDTTNYRYVKELARDVLRGKLKAAQEGRWNGGRAPFGYRLAYTVETSPAGRQVRLSLLVVDPETAPIVRDMFRDYAAGMVSLYTLAQSLNTRGVKPPRAQRWTPTSVRSILTNEVYLGEYVWNKTDQAKFFGVVDLELKPKTVLKRSHGACSRRPRQDHIRRDNYHEALVDRDTFDTVGRLLVENRKGTSRGERGTFVLRSLLRCAHCGKPMIGKTVSWGSKKHQYRCGSYNALGKQGCAVNSLDEVPLRDSVIRKLQEGLLNETKLEEIRREMLALVEEGGSTGAAEVSRLTRELAGLEPKLARASERYLTEEDADAAKAHQATFNALLARKKEIEATLREASVRAADGPAVDKVIERALQLMRRLEKALGQADPLALRAVLRDLIDHIDLYFRHEEKDGRTFCTFVRGIIYVKPGVLPEVTAEACRGPELHGTSPCQPNTSSDRR